MVFSGPHCHSCHTEGVCCSTSYGITNSCVIPSFDSRRVPDPAGIRCILVDNCIIFFDKDNCIINRTNLVVTIFLYMIPIGVFLAD
jgi:hypothetical protein